MIDSSQFSEIWNVFFPQEGRLGGGGGGPDARKMRTGGAKRSVKKMKNHYYFQFLSIPNSIGRSSLAGNLRSRRQGGGLDCLDSVPHADDV